MKYRVKTRVEINGKLRNADDVLEESEFRKAAHADELDEAESLLRTGHIEVVAE